MTTKLTLTIEQSVIEKSKGFAKSKKQSLSNLIENYLKSLIREERNSNIEVSPIVESLKGSFSDNGVNDYKKVL